MTTIINNLIARIKDNAKVILCLFCACFIPYIVLCFLGSQTQVAMYSQEIPSNMVCILDKVADVYLCSPDTAIPWYLSTEGVLAHVE